MNVENVTNDAVNNYKRYPFETHQLFLRSYLTPDIDPIKLGSGVLSIVHSINPTYKKYEIKEDFYDKMYFLNF